MVTVPISEYRAHRSGLERIGLSEHGRRGPDELSDSQQQRVTIARAFVPQSCVLLLDKPFSALNVFRRRGLHEQLLDLGAESKPTIMIVTHSMGEVVTLADRMAVMRPRPGWLDETDAFELARPHDVRLGVLRECGPTGHSGLSVPAGGRSSRFHLETWMT